MNRTDTVLEQMKTTAQMLEEIGPRGRKLVSEVYEKRFADVNTDDELDEMIRNGRPEIARITHIIIVFIDFIDAQDRFEIFYSEKLKNDVLVKHTDHSCRIIRTGNELFRFLVSEVGGKDKAREIIEELEDDRDRSYYLNLLNKMPKRMK